VPYPPQGTKANIYDIRTCLVHRSYIFPDDIDRTVTVTAGSSDGEFGDWAEIADNEAATFSSKATSDLHISSLRVRSESVADALYLLEIGYGESAKAVAVVDPYEFGAGTKKIEGDEQVRFRPPIIPAGQKIYYRMKCETKDATCTIVFRYHYH